MITLCQSRKLKPDQIIRSNNRYKYKAHSLIHLLYNNNQIVPYHLQLGQGNLFRQSIEKNPKEEFQILLLAWSERQK